MAKSSGNCRKATVGRMSQAEKEQRKLQSLLNSSHWDAVSQWEGFTPWNGENNKLAWATAQVKAFDAAKAAEKAAKKTATPAGELPTFYGEWQEFTPARRYVSSSFSRSTSSAPAARIVEKPVTKAERLLAHKARLEEIRHERMLAHAAMEARLAAKAELERVVAARAAARVNRILAARKVAAEAKARAAARRKAAEEAARKAALEVQALRAARKAEIVHVYNSNYNAVIVNADIEELVKKAVSAALQALG